MKLTIRHTLTFSLGTPARAVQHVLLTALATPQQKIERWSIEMPGFAEAPTFRDGFGNKAHVVSQVKPEPKIVVTVTGAVETIDKAGVLGRLEYDPPPAMFRRPTEATKADTAMLAGLKDGADRIALFHELMDRSHNIPGTPGQTQSQGTEGRSQGQLATARQATDMAQAFIGAARALGIPSRYVTGYLLEDGLASFHSWAEGWDDGLGWIGFDPMLNVCPTDNYIRIASGLDATSTMPIRSVPVWSEMPVEVVEITAAE
jgi:transglutaminase-like putative cysteine protease